MTLTSALNIALRGLNVAQEGVSVSSNNIANAETPGYVKQITTQEALVSGGIGQGAAITGIVAQVDQQLLREMRIQAANVGTSSVISEYYDKIQKLYGLPNDGNSINSRIDDFFSSMQSLSDNPDVSSLRLNAVTDANELASSISSLAYDLQSTRLDIDREISQSIVKINSIINELANTNAQVGKFPEGTQGRLNIEQTRELKLRELSEYIPINSLVDESGALSVTTTGGVALLDSKISNLSYIGAGSVQAFINDFTLNPIIANTVESDGSEGEFPQTLVSGGKSDSVTSTLTAGKIYGLLQLRDVEIPKLLEQIDNLAQTITDKVNAIHNDGAGFPPPSSITGTKAISSTTEVGFSGKVMIAVIDQDGTPATSPYGDEVNFRPLVLDLSTLDSGSGAGEPDVQSIINEINDYFGPVQNRATVGNLRDIRLSSTSSTITDGGTGQFELQLDNISTQDATVVIQSITVVDPLDSSTTYNAATLPSPNSYVVNPGDRERTGIPFTVDFGGDDNRSEYTVRVRVQVTDADGNASVADIDYTVSDNVTNNKNTYYSADNVTAVSGDSSFIIAPSSLSYARAELVDENGTPVSAGQLGYLKITTTAGRSYGIVIDELDSQEVGLATDSDDPSLKGFSDFFQLNDLFVRDSEGNVDAYNMMLRSDILSNPNRLSTGELVLSNQPSSSDEAIYTYEIGSGNNSVAKRLAALDEESISFDTAGGLPSTTTSISGYIGLVIGFMATKSTNFDNNKNADSIGMQGLRELFQKSSGVNTDEELARLVELENNFRAATRIITVVQQMFEALTAAI